MIHASYRSQSVRLSHIAMALLAVATQAHAQPPDPRAIRWPHMVVLLGTRNGPSV
jgi:hypothetical protein